MIDYETFCKIRDCHDREGLTIVQTARALALDPRTVAKWLGRSRQCGAARGVLPQRLDRGEVYTFPIGRRR